MPWSRTALVVVLALAGAACAPALDTGFPPPSETPSESASPSPTATGTVDVTGPIDVDDNVFAPKVGRVKVGEEVEWSQSGSLPHTVSAADESFDSHPDCTAAASDKCLNKGDTYSHTFEEPGEFLYYCKLHGTPSGTFMAGTIVVEA